MAGKKISQLTSGSLSDLPLSGVTPVVYSGITKQHTLSDLRNKLVDSGSHHFTGSQYIKGNLEISGSITAHEYILSSSVTNIEIQNVNGSSKFGNDQTDTHIFTGSVVVTGSLHSTSIVAKEFLFVSGYAIIGDPYHHTGSDPEALHVGTTDSYNIAHFKGDNDYYSQVYITNLNSGSNASTDLVVVADNGTETVHFVDLGINSSTYTGGLVGYENDAYLLNVGKDLYIGTVGGTEHPAKLKLFANNSWENSQITIHTGSQITFNTSSITEGYTYEFSGSVKLNSDLKIDGDLHLPHNFIIRSQVSGLPGAFGFVGNENTDVLYLQSINGISMLFPNGVDEPEGYYFTTSSISFPDGTIQTTAYSGIPTYISSGPTAPGSSVVANETDVDVNFSGVGTIHSFSQTGMTTNGFTVLSHATSSFVDDAAAAAGGVPLQGLYRSGSFVMIRLT
jgi:cytoskeletal protein CcmA (bactofilin family)